MKEAHSLQLLSCGQVFRSQRRAAAPAAAQQAHTLRRPCQQAPEHKPNQGHICLHAGIRISDHGAKQGLNGVDNGQVWVG